MPGRRDRDAGVLDTRGQRTAGDGRAVIRPDLRSRPHRTTVIAKRLRFFEDEHADVARLWALMTADMIGLRDSQPRQDMRIATLVGIAAALLTVLGAEPGSVAIWVLAMADDEATEAAADFGNDLVEQLLLLHGRTSGEA